MTVATVDSNSARANWRKLIDTAITGKDVVVTRFGSPVVAVIDYDDYVAIIEELDDLRAAKRADAILDALDIGDTSTEPWEDVRADMIAENLLDG